MFTGFAIAIELLLLFSALGAAIDALVLPRQNSRMQLTLIRWWSRIDDLKFKDIAQLLVESYIRIERHIFGNFPSARWLITAIAISVVVTTGALIIGRMLGLYLTLWCGQNLENFGGIVETLKVLFYASLTYFRYNVDRSTVYGLNLTFDALTLVATLNLLLMYVNQSRVIQRYAIILFDIIACVIFFYTCSFLAFYADSTTSGIKVPYQKFYEHLGALFTEDSCTNYHVFTSTLVFSASVFLPTASYLLGILFFLTAKTTLEGCRWVVSHVLELSVSTEKTVFFYTGTLLGVVAAIGKTIVEVSKLLFERAP